MYNISTLAGHQYARCAERDRSAAKAAALETPGSACSSGAAAMETGSGAIAMETDSGAIAMETGPRDSSVLVDVGPQVTMQGDLGHLLAGNHRPAADGASVRGRQKLLLMFCLLALWSRKVVVYLLVYTICRHVVYLSICRG